MPSISQLSKIVTSLAFLWAATGFAQGDTKLEIIHADDLIYDTSNGITAKRLIGNVAFKQDETFMYCDSAYFYSETNSFQAFNHVRIVEGDSLNLTGDHLDYDGNKKFAKFTGNIVMVDKNMVLTTKNLDYDRNNQLAYYYNGGTIVNKEENMELKSEKGKYFPQSKLFHFQKNVVLVTDEYTIYSDTLHQNNESNISYFYGPTTIISDSSTIYCEKGWYDKNNGVSEFIKNAVITNESQILKADSIRFLTEFNLGFMFGHVEITDTTENISVFGDYAENNSKDSTSMVTGNALLVQQFDSDSLFLHGDTLFSEFDSLHHRLIRAYSHVKLYKQGLAGKCDSIVFSESDSLIKMFGDPVIWADGNQLTAEHIQIKHYDGKLQWLELNRKSFIVYESKPTHFNQISGKNMINYFDDGKLKTINVFENGKTIYYATEESGAEIGVNQASADDLIILLDSNEIKKIKFYRNPVAKLTPLDQVDEKTLKLDGFKWRVTEQPKKPKDVFVW
jgi:lipopolysaccharide export system protein LptA